MSQPDSEKAFSGSQNLKYVMPVLTGIIFLLAFQLFYFINQNGVNILFSDQWDTYQPLFRGVGDWEIFFAQVGQLRLGLGGLFSKFIAVFSGWNTRSEIFSLGVMMVINAILAIYLKWRLFRKLTVWDSLIIFICLGLPQFEAPIAVAFPSHGIIPLFFVLIYGICLTFENFKLKLATLLIVNFLAVFTGWGLFVGFISPIIFLIFIFKTKETRDRIYSGLTFFVSIGAIFRYFYDYQFLGGVECFTFPHYPLSDYWFFLAKLFSNTIMLFCGRKNYLWEIFGSVIVILILTVALWSAWRILFTKTIDSKAFVLFAFVTFSLLFGMMSAVGRVCTDVCMADGGRYQPLLVPAWLAFIYSINLLPKESVKISLFSLLVIACFILPESRLKIYSEKLRGVSQLKINWRDCYLQKENAEMCDRETDFKIFLPVESKFAQERIDFLKERKLNFFAESR